MTEGRISNRSKQYVWEAWIGPTGRHFHAWSSEKSASSQAACGQHIGRSWSHMGAWSDPRTDRCARCVRAVEAERVVSGHVHIIEQHWGGRAFIHHEHSEGPVHDWHHDQAERHGVKLGPGYTVTVGEDYFLGLRCVRAVERETE